MITNPRTDRPIGRVFHVVVKACERWSQDNVPRLSAAVSFYAALSLAPFLIIATVVGVYWLDIRPESKMSLVEQVRQTFGSETGILLTHIVDNAQSRQSASILASLISFVIMFFSASNLFIQFDDSVRTIWGVTQKGSYVRLMISSRLTAFASVIAVGVSLIAWLVLDARMAFLARQMSSLQLGRVLSFISTVVVLSALCIISMKRPAGVRLNWSDLLPGALVASIAISCAKYLLSLYFAHSGIDTVYGPAGALVVVLLWIYYCSQIYFFGLEITYVYAHTYGSLVNKNTVPEALIQPSAIQDPQ